MTRATITRKLRIFDPSVLPSWLPAVGTRGNVSLNVLRDTRDATNPDPRLIDGTGPMLSAWCSTVYVPNLGRYGSILVFGGGHADGQANSVHRYDIDSRLWTRISDPHPIGIPYPRKDRADLSDSGQYWTPPLYGWPTDDLWTDESKTAVFDGAVASTHTYSLLDWAPPEVVGGTNGWLVLVPFGGWPHYVDLDAPSGGWQRMPNHLPAKPGSDSCVLVDVSRKLLFGYFNQQNGGWATRIGQIDLTSFAASEMPSYTSIPSSGHRISYSVLFHDLENDVYLMHSTRERFCDTATYFRVLDPVTLVRHTPPVVGAGPVQSSYPAQVGTLEWVPSDRRLVWWSGLDETLWSLTSTGDPRTDPWEWSSQIVPGVTVSQRDGNTMFKRLHWVEELGSFFIVTRHTGPVQCWRVR